MRDTPLLCVGPDELDAAWQIARPFIESGYSALDEFMPEDMLEWLRAGKGLLWLAVEGGRVHAALTTSLEKRPSGLSLRMVSSGGDNLPLMLECEKVLVEYARREGCVKITAEGRNGWARTLPGFRRTRVHLEKVL